jgi:class 3 adenylate cyclase
MRLSDSIIKYSGTLERYAGDGVMVVFNDPVPVENPALEAVLMALEMREAIEDRQVASAGGTTMASGAWLCGLPPTTAFPSQP